jgi:hypothetical protein
MKVHAEGLKESDGVVFKTIPAGRYSARVSKVEEAETGDKSKHPGSPMLKFQFKILPGSDYENEVLFTQILLPAKWMEERVKKMQVAKLKQLVSAAGLDLNDDSFDTEDLYGQTVDIVVIEKSVDGKPANEVVEVLPQDEN